jgi:hypothetical protein
MHRQALVTLDEPFVFEPLQELLNGSVLGLGCVGVKFVAYLASGELIVTPEQIHHSQFSVGQSRLLHMPNPLLFEDSDDNVS